MTFRSVGVSESRGKQQAAGGKRKAGSLEG
jgi:hypothetical protein